MMNMTSNNNFDLISHSQSLNSQNLRQSLPFKASNETYVDSRLTSSFAGNTEPLLNPTSSIKKRNWDQINTFNDSQFEVNSKAEFLTQMALEISQDLMNRFHNYQEACNSLKMIEQIEKDINLLHQEFTLSPSIYEKSKNLIMISRDNIASTQLLDAEMNKAILSGEIRPTFAEYKQLRDDQDVRKKFEQLKKLRLEKYTKPEVRKDRNHLLARKVAKAQFAYSIGVKPSLTPKGVHGAMFMKSVTGKKQGVFKLPESKSSYVRQMGEKIGLSQKSLLNEGTFSDVCAEKAAYMIAEKLNCPYLTPSPVAITSFSKDEIDTGSGAFLVFCKNAQLASEVKEKFDSPIPFSLDTLNRFQIFAIFDYLLGNLDRHDENWMVTLHEDGSVKEIIPIDNANILPKQKPTLLNVDGWKNAFAWRYLNIAKSEFTDEAKEFIKKLDDKFVDEICNEIENDQDIISLYQKELSQEIEPGKNNFFLSPESRQEMKNRVAILKLQSVQTPEDLAVASGVPSSETIPSWGNWLLSWFY